MYWQKAKDFGVIKIDDKKVYLYYSTISKEVINTGESVRDARWAGDAVVVYLANGKVRRYQSTITYTNI